MNRLAYGLTRRWLHALLHIDDTPERTAAAFSLGVLFGFSPLLGFHTLLAIAFAFLLNLNRVAVLLGVYTNLPWFIGAYYTFTTMLGAAITGRHLPPGLAHNIRDLFELSLLHHAFWQRLIFLLRPLFLPYAVGSTIGAIGMAALAYPVALALITSERRIHEMMQQHHRESGH